MMVGTVELDLDALVAISVRGGGGVESFEAVVDTGFSKAFSLPPDAIYRLGLKFLYGARAALANGAEVDMDVYEAEVQWHGEWRRVQVDAADTDPLIGMRLIRGNELRIEVTEGGSVTIRPLPPDH